MRITELKILQGIPFTKEDNRWLTFNSLAEQETFFSQYSIINFYELSFVRGFAYKKIKVEVDYDTILYANYVMFKNRDYNDKWLYAYIKDFTYISDGCTEIEIEMDYFQSYISEIKFMPCYIDRQMAFFRDDISVIANQEEEELDIDINYNKCIAHVDYFYNDWSVVIQYKPNLIVEGLTGGGSFDLLKFFTGDTYTYKNLIEDSNYNDGLFIANKYWTGCAIQTYRIRNQADADVIAEKAWQLEILGYSIMRMYLMPTVMLNTYTQNAIINPPTHPLCRNDKMIVGLYDTPYKPKNNKSYLYVYYEVSNNSSKIKTYKTKSFFDITGLNVDLCKFAINVNCLNGISGITYPIYYKTTSSTLNTQWNYGVELGETPDTTWNDQLANIMKSIGGILANIGSMALTGAPFGKGEQKNMTKQTLAAPFESPSGGVATSSLLNLLCDNIGWIYKLFAPLHLTEIDDYFSIYGYKMNICIEPFIHNKQRWNYVKTQNANIQGLIPIKAKKEIEEALNKGITFWHDKNNFDYIDVNGELTNPYIDDGSGLTADYKLF